MVKKNWRLNALFKGKVQGVGFRWTVREHAEKLSIVGNVTNLRNGHVALIAEGKRPQLEQLLLQIQEEPGFAQITEVVTSFQEGSGEFKSFDIHVSK